MHLRIIIFYIGMRAGEKNKKEGKKVVSGRWESGREQTGWDRKRSAWWGVFGP